MTAVLALTSAFIIGGSDFLLGIGSRASAPQRVPIASNLASGLTLLLLVPFITASNVTLGALGVGALSGVSGAIGFTLYLMALRDGKMSIAAPVTATVTAVILVAVGVLSGDQLTVLASIGIAMAVIAGVLISWSDDPDDNSESGIRSFYFALVAGTVFALFFWSLGQIPEEAGLWPLVTARVVSVSLQLAIAIIVTGGWRVPRNTLRVTIPAGVFEAIAVILAAEALRRGPLSVAGVLTGLYPISTVLLAGAMLRERLQRQQWIAVGLALLAVPLTTL